MKLNQNNLKAVADRLKSPEFDGVLVACHRSPDGDACGSAHALVWALRKLGKKAVVFCPDPFGKDFSYLTQWEENEKLATSVIASLRLNLPSLFEDIHDTSGGLYNRLKEMSFKTNTIESLICAAESKNFTKARIRRSLFYSLLGVTSSQFKELPEYTQLLALDSQGRAMLKTIGKQSAFPILTKPSDTDKLPDVALPQKAISDMADSIFQLTKPIPKDGNYALRFTPFVKK